MPVVFSRHETKIAYGGTLAPHPALRPQTPPVAIIAPGKNSVTDAQLAELKADKAFLAHLRSEFLQIMPAAPAVEPPASAVEPPASAPIVDPARARQPNETERSYLARMKKAGLEPLPLPSADDAKLVLDFFALSAADQQAYYETMTKAEQALIDANRPKA